MSANHATARLLDDTNRQILSLLQEDARLSYSEIGRRVGLTAPAVAERVRRLEEAGIITGYHAAVDPAALGYPVTVYIHVTANDGRCDAIRDYATDQPSVTECYCVTGGNDILIKGSFESVQALESIVRSLTRYGSVSTSLVLSNYLPHRALD